MPVLGPETIKTIKQRHRESSIKGSGRKGEGEAGHDESPFQNQSSSPVPRESISPAPRESSQAVTTYPAKVAAGMLREPLSSGQKSLGRSTGRSNSVLSMKESLPLGAVEPESTARPCCQRAFEGQEVDPAEAQGCVDSFGNTCLIWAASVGNVLAVQQLLSNSDNINAANKNGMTALQVAVRHTHHEVVDLLLSAGADPTLKNTSRGMTSLHCAVLCADPRAMILKLLKSQGWVEPTPASQLRDQKVAEMQEQRQKLESEGQPFSAKMAGIGWLLGVKKGTASGRIGSLRASREMSVEAGEDHHEGVDPEAAKSKEAAREAAKAAMIKEEEEENQRVQMLQEQKRVQQHLSRFLETLDILGQSALVLAINQARMEAMDTLQQANASAHTRLHFAAQHGHDAAVKELLKAGAPPDEPDTEGVTPVMKASMNGHGAVLSTLLRKKADLHRKVPGTDLTCILLASAGKHHSAVVQLIDHGARIEDRGARGNTPIMFASAAGSLPIVQHLIKCGADVDVANEDQDTPLHVAARGGFTDVLRELLRASALYDVRNNLGETAYVTAVRAGHDDAAAVLEEGGSNPHFRLHWAVENDGRANPEADRIPSLTDLLLSQVPVNLRDQKGWTALTAAAKKGMTYAVMRLMEAGADPNIASLEGITPLLAASENGHDEVVHVLLACQANIGAYTQIKRTSVHLAARNNHSLVLKQLLDTCATLPEGDSCAKSNQGLKTMVSEVVQSDGFGTSQASHYGEEEDQVSGAAAPTLTMDLAAKVSAISKSRPSSRRPSHVSIMALPPLRTAVLDARDQRNGTAVTLAAKYGNVESIQLLVDAGADIHIPDLKGWTALIHASYNGHLEICMMLVAAGASLDHATNNGETALIWAANQDRLEVVKYLILSKANIGAVTAYNHSALTMAAANGNCQVIEHLISKGSNIEHKDVAGCTPLMAAARNNHLDAVKLLLARNAQVNPQEGSPDSALISAARYASAEIVDILIQAGADPNFRVNGDPPLKHAASRGELKMVRTLLECPEVQVDSPDTDNAPSLHFAIREGHFKVVKELINRGADINSIDWKGSTPLTNAALYGQETIVQLLLDSGSDPNHYTKGGMMAVHRAAQAGHLGCLKLFLLPLADPVQDKLVATSSGQTLMHIAASYGQTQILKFLLYEVGLDVNQTCQGQQLLRPAIDFKQWHRYSLTVDHENNMISSLSVDEGFTAPALAVHEMTNDRLLSYIEFEILEGGHPCNISLGQGIDNGRYDYQPGSFPETVGFCGIDGCCLSGAQSTISQYGPKFGKGDTIGIIYNPAFATISYTRNGKHLGTAARNVQPGKQVTMIGFGAPGIKVELNLKDDGKPFECDFDDLLLEEEQLQNPGNHAYPWKAKDKVCPIHMAASSKCIESLELLLRLGAVVNQRDVDGWTALHYAAFAGWVEGTKMLLEHNAEANVCTFFDCTPILFAVKNSHADVVRVLLEYGAQLNCGNGPRDRKDRTLLMWAAQTGNSETLEMLLQRDVPIKAKDKLGRTALQYACNEQVVIYLENAMQQMHTYRNIFQISKQQEAKVGSEGLVLMAKHLVSGNLTALKFHKHKESRDFSAEVLRGLVSARKVVATIPLDLPASDVIFDDEEKYPEYPYCLVMEGGVEDLVESMSKSGSTPMPENQIRYIFECISASVHILHTVVGRVHHDVKCTNFVRFFDGSYRLIDFDNSRMANVEEMGLTTLEICPPEMATAFLSGTKIMSKFSADMWAMGCVLYEMVTCQQFLTKFRKEWEGRRVDNSMLREGMQILSQLTQDQVNNVIDGLREQKKGRMLIELTSDLMYMLLQVDPEMRCTSEDVVLHAFLKGGTTSTMDEKSLVGLHKKVDRVVSLATSIEERTLNIHELSAHTRDGIAACLGKISGLRSLMMECATRTECPSTFSISPYVPPKELMRASSEASSDTFMMLHKWLNMLRQLSIGKIAMGDVVKIVLGVRHLRLVLLCERCFKETASYRIEEQPPIVGQLMPAFLVGFQLAKAYNLGASVGRFFFPALPAIPPDLLAKSQQFIEGMKDKHSAVEFECISESIDQHHAQKANKTPKEDPRSTESQLGWAYRQLANFLTKHDPARDWGGLSCVQTEDNDGKVDINGKQYYKGGVLWVCQECLMGIRVQHSPAASNQVSATPGTARGIHDQLAPAAGNQVSPEAGSRMPDDPAGSGQTLQGEPLKPQPSSLPPSAAYLGAHAMDARAVATKQAQPSSPMSSAPMSFDESSQDSGAERTSSSGLCGLFRSNGSGSNSRYSNKVVPATL